MILYHIAVCRRTRACYVSVTQPQPPPLEDDFVEDGGGFGGDSDADNPINGKLLLASIH